jgi:hypothetical protein
LDCIAARVDTAPTEKAPLHFGERWLAAKYFGAVKTKARCRTANTETSILLFANTISLAKHQIIDRKIGLGNSEMLISYKSNFDRGELGVARRVVTGQSPATTQSQPSSVR